MCGPATGGHVRCVTVFKSISVPLVGHKSPVGHKSDLPPLSLSERQRSSTYNQEEQGEPPKSTPGSVPLTNAQRRAT